MKSYRTLLLGATGYTGKIIAAKLDEENISFAISGRSEEKLLLLAAQLHSKPPIIHVDIFSFDELLHVFHNFDIIINCIGPFNVLSNDIIKAAAVAGKIYLDITGEQDFVYQSYLNYRHSKGTLVHSVAFESCLIDILADRWLDKNKKYRQLSSYYYFKKSRPSPGTRLTMKVAKHFPLYRVKDGNLETATPMSFKSKLNFTSHPGITHGYFMPYPEVLFFQNRYHALHIASYLLMTEQEGTLASLSQVAPVPDINLVMEQHKKIASTGPSIVERNDQEFELILYAEGLEGDQQLHSIRGKDMYGITAFLVVKAVKEIMICPDIPTGIRSPSQLKIWENVWEELKNDHYLY